MKIVRTPEQGKKSIIILAKFSGLKLPIYIGAEVLVIPEVNYTFSTTPHFRPVGKWVLVELALRSAPNCVEDVDLVSCNIPNYSRAWKRDSPMERPSSFTRHQSTKERGESGGVRQRLDFIGISGVPTS